MKSRPPLPDIAYPESDSVLPMCGVVSYSPEVKFQFTLNQYTWPNYHIFDYCGLQTFTTIHERHKSC